MALVTNLKVVTKVTGDLYGDISRSVLAVGSRLNSQGYGVYPRIDSATNQVTWELKRSGQPFDDQEALKNLSNAVNAIGLRVGNTATWVAQAVAFVATVPITSAKGVIAAPGAALELAKKKKAEYDACIAAGGNALTCSGAVVGIPIWAWWVGGAVAGLYVLNSLTSAKRAFLSGTPTRAGVAEATAYVRKIRNEGKKRFLK